MLTRLFDGEGRGSKNATKKFIRKIKDLEPDLVILHNLHGYYLNLSRIAEYLHKVSESGVKIIWRIHDLAPLTGHCAFFPGEDCKFLSEGCGKCPMRAAYPKSFVDRSRKNLARRRRILEKIIPQIEITCVSQWLSHRVRNSFLGKARKIEVVYPQVEPEFKPGEAKAGFVFTAASPWQKWKGYHELFELRRLIPEEIPMVVAGASKQQAKQLKKHGIIPVGRIDSSKEMAWYISRASVVVNPSHAESYGLLQREAIACDTPYAGYELPPSLENLQSPHPELRFVLRGDVQRLAENVIELFRK